MTDEERKTLIERIQRATKEARTLPKEEVLRRLINKGFATEDGQLSAEYGGRRVASR